MNDPFKKYRRRFRAWRNTRRLKRELARYRYVFESRGLKVPGEKDIWAAIASKHPGLKVKPKGSLKILAVYHHYNWENQALKPSLEKFGSVRHYDWFDEFNHQEKSWHASGKAKMNRELVERTGKWVRDDGIDVIFTYLSGGVVDPQTVREMAATGVPMFNLNLNDKEAFVGKVRNGLAMGVRDICRHFTLCWTSTEDALEKYCVEGALPIYLAEGANPEKHKPFAVERTLDVSFVGQCYGNRPEIVQKLKDHGIRIEAYGFGWPNGPLSTEEMVRMYSKSKINLGFGGVDGHQEVYCLKGRDFEIPMSGGLYLTEYHPELEGVYDLEKEIVTYRNFEELSAKIRYLLANPDAAESIRQRGFRRSLDEHSWEKRFEKIFGLMGLVPSAAGG